jgi:hypothetical protein
MARRIVHDDVNVEIGGDMLFDGVEEAAEFLRPVARHAFADGSGLHVEGANYKVFGGTALKMRVTAHRRRGLSQAIRIRSSSAKDAGASATREAGGKHVHTGQNRAVPGQIFASR